MLRLYLIFLLLLNGNVIAADTKSGHKLFSLYPYKTTLDKHDIAKIVGIPLPKPDIDISNNATPIEHPSILNQSQFSVLTLDALAMMPCAPTPVLTERIKFNKYKDISSNNLRRAVGSPDVASGHIIYIKGFLRDVNCHPIANTDITIWQANAYGVYNDTAKHTPDYDPYFQNAGFTITGTDGSFEFITILPGSIDDQAPFINFYIAIPNEISFETQIFFPNHQLNSSDIRLKKLSEPVRNLLMSSIAPVNQEELDEGFYMVIDLIANVINRY
ncbi:MAG: hypothetical protein HOM96_05050 [Rickettsiales bacterium]|jgi:protocatechuate 3,4-dioxygenase beta subunit|nr:hypothetical protein [Rickettsiales bacterium]